MNHVPGNPAVGGGGGMLPPFQGPGFVNHRKANPLVDAINAMKGGGAFGPILRNEHRPDRWYVFSEPFGKHIGVWFAKEFTFSNPTRPGRLEVGDFGEASETSNLIIWSIDEIRARRRLHAPGDIGGGFALHADQATQLPVVLHLAPSVGGVARLGKTVCNGPRGEEDFTDNRQWVQILRISAPCDPTEPWSYEDAPPVADPCHGASPAEGSGSSGEDPEEVAADSAEVLPDIVSAFCVGHSVSKRHMQPGKLVLLTPLETYADDGSKDGIRWACEFIDPTDNKQNCAQDSSSSGSESGSGSGSEGSGSHPGSCSNPVVQVELKREGNELVQIEHFCDGSTNETRIDLCCDSSSSEGESSEGESSEGESSEGSSSGGESSGGGSSGGGSSGGGSSGESSGGSSSGEVQCVECGQCCFSTSATVSYNKPTLSASIPDTPPYDANLQALYQWAINEFNTSAPSSLPYSSSLSSYYSTPTWGWVGSNTFDFEGNLARLRVVFQPCGGNESPSFNIQIEINGTPTPGARGTMSVGTSTWGDTDCCHWVIESAEVWYFSSGTPLIVKEPIGPITFEMEGNECCNDGGDCAEGTADCETGECEE